MRLLWSLIAAIYIGACVSSEPAELKPAQMVLDLSAQGGFFDRGFPSDSRRDGDVLKLEGFPQQDLPLVADYIKVAQANASGFATALPIYMQMQGLQAEQIRLLPAPDDYAFANAPLQLIDIDPSSPYQGQRYPLQAKFQALGDSYRPQGLLQARSLGQYLREDTQYALVATKALAKPGVEINQHPVLMALLAQTAAADLSLNTYEQTNYQKLLPGFTQLSQFWQSQNQDLDQIIAATVWKTGHPSRYLKRILAQVEQWPLPSLSSAMVLEPTDDEFCIVKTSWDVPGLQQGQFPYVLPAHGGAIAMQNGLLEQVYQRQTPVHLTIPKQAQPTAGFPLYLYHHGTSGLSSQIFERGQTLADKTKTQVGSPASIAAQAGFAGASMGGHFGGDHNNQVAWTKLLSDVLPIDLNIGQYNFLNIQAMAGHLQQQLFERILFRRLVEQLALAPELCPGVDLQGAGQIRFDANQQVSAGQSLGAFTALGAVLHDAKPYQGVVLSGAGSYNLRLVMNLTAFGEANQPLGNLLLPVFFKAQNALKDELHPLWAVSDLALAHADVAYSSASAVQTNSNNNNMLVFQGFYDDWVGTASQRQLSQALVLDFAGFDPAPTPAEQLLPAALWSGAQQRIYPLQANRGDYTQASVRYNEDGILSGHHVLFQYPQAQEQLLCWLRSLTQQPSPTLLAPEQGCD